jgi:glycerol-3-phosphate dehydrogenase (NAD(P)+)
MSKVTVLGAGAWGSTMAQVLSDAGNHVLIWGRDQEIVDEINANHTNRKYLDENVLYLLRPCEKTLRAGNF